MFRRRYHSRHRHWPAVGPLAPAPPSFESTYLSLVEAKAKTLTALEGLQKEGFDPAAEALTIELAREAASHVAPEHFVSKQREIETRRQQFQERLDALKLFATQFEKLLEKYRYEKPTELANLLTAKIKECQAQSTQPGAIASDMASACERLQHELSVLQESAEPRTKPKRKTPAKSA
jgi:hypothetical protein